MEMSLRGGWEENMKWSTFELPTPSPAKKAGAPLPQPDLLMLAAARDATSFTRCDPLT